MCMYQKGYTFYWLPKLYWLPNGYQSYWLPVLLVTKVTIKVNVDEKEFYSLTDHRTKGGP